MAIKSEVLISGLSFPEAPRWHDDKLWFSDFYSKTVFTLDKNNALHPVVEVQGQPSGLGWTPEGDLLIVSMIDRKLMRFNGIELSVVADLKAYASWHCNDMVVTAGGDAYIGNFGFDMGNEKPRATVLLHVNRKAEVRIAAEEMWFPNGSVITNDGKTLIVAESWSRCLTAFDILDNGVLNNRRVWADLGEYMPDGISLDQEGGIWVAVAGTPLVIRVEAGGRITHRVSVGQAAYACAVGGAGGQALYVCTSPSSDAEECEKSRAGRIEYLDLRAVV